MPGGWSIKLAALAFSLVTCMNKLISRLFVAALLAASPLLPGLRAQDPGVGDSSPGGPQQQQQTPTSVPIDGGASLLLAGGVAYSLRRLRRKRS